MSQSRLLVRSIGMVIFLLLLFPIFAIAHPVTFKDGQEISVNNYSNVQKLSYTYSFTNNLSLGMSYLKMHEEYSLLEGNYLINRWNEIGSQANLYVGVTGGMRSNDTVAGGFIEADWESRKYYISSKASYLDNFYMTKNRVGLAPYLAEYNELNTWIMIEHTYESKSNFIEINPLLRFFYKNLLWEIGVGLKGNVLFNFMVHL